jgi:hypothetical protein
VQPPATPIPFRQYYSRRDRTHARQERTATIRGNFRAVKLVADAKLPFARPVVFAAYRDHLLDLLPYLPNVRRIDVGSRVERGPIVEMQNVWHGGGEIPAVARAVLHESMLSWTDHARWDAEEFVCEWKIQTHAFTEAVSCEGRHSFVSDGDGTRLETRGDLTIDASKVPAVPRLLARRVGGIVAEFLAAKIQPNLVEVSKGLAQYLQKSESPVS